MNRIESTVLECDWEPHGSSRRWRVVSTFVAPDPEQHKPAYRWPLPTVYFPTLETAQRYAKAN